MDGIPFEAVLRGLIDRNCAIVAIRYDKEDGEPPAWRLLHNPAFAKSKSSLSIRAREENSDASKAWRLDRIRDIFLPDSSRLSVTSWYLNTPIKFDRPLITPTGGRVKVINVFVDIDFRVIDRTVEIVKSRLSTTSNIEGSTVNVCSNRSGQAWAAGWSLSWTVSGYLKAMTLQEVETNESLRLAMWKRYAGWWRSSGLTPFPNYKQKNIGVMNALGRFFG